MFNLFQPKNKNKNTITPALYLYKVNGVDTTGADCQTTVWAKNPDEARKQVMKANFTEARAYLDASDARDYSIHFRRIISVVRI